MSILKFPKENLISLHFFVDQLNFPVVAASYTEWEEQQIVYLEGNYKSLKYNTESICRWCINHNIQYQILYPIDKRSAIKHPYKFLKYLELKRKLKK